MLSSFKSKIGRVYCPVYILELLTSVPRCPKVSFNNNGYGKHSQGLRKTTLVKNSRIYTGQYAFPILLLNDDNVLGQHN